MHQLVAKLEPHEIALDHFVQKKMIVLNKFVSADQRKIQPLTSDGSPMGLWRLTQKSFPILNISLVLVKKGFSILLASARTS